MNTNAPYLTYPALFLRSLFDAAVNQALPAQRIASMLPPVPKGRTVVIGAGKAAGAMALAVQACWPADAPLSGMVITRYGHTPPLSTLLPTSLLHGESQRIDIVEAAHPIPDAQGLVASERMLQMVEGLSADDLVLCLISGGGSSLLVAPAAVLSLQEKQAITDALLKSGANIAQMNCVRKHLSRVKGGRLAAACAPAAVCTLVISDVPGDDLSIIASGPTVPDPSTCAQALHILDTYGIDVPSALRASLLDGLLETPKPNDPVFDGHSVHMVATPMQSLQAAAEKARQAGLNAYILADNIEGESVQIGRLHGALARHIALNAGQAFAAFTPPCVVLSGGETTVTIKSQPNSTQPTGQGGRAGEFCLGLAQSLQGLSNVWGLAADTDGIDGVCDNAGAVVSPHTVALAVKQGLDIQQCIDRHDAYGFFAAIDQLVTTGPTHTNVNDFRAVLIV